MTKANKITDLKNPSNFFTRMNNGCLIKVHLHKKKTPVIRIATWTNTDFLHVSLSLKNTDAEKAWQRLSWTQWIKRGLH